MILSDLQYLYFVTVLTAGVSVAWFAVDTLRLRRALREDSRDPIVRDRIFGSLVGLAICVWGIIVVIDFWT